MRDEAETEIALFCSNYDNLEIEVERQRRFNN